jgi:hypothetical protein
MDDKQPTARFSRDKNDIEFLQGLTRDQRITVLMSGLTDARGGTGFGGEEFKLRLKARRVKHPQKPQAQSKP